jgi:[heparan sulfate]-glucosamine 3-sulfotransferase 5
MSGSYVSILSTDGELQKPLGGSSSSGGGRAGSGCKRVTRMRLLAAVVILVMATTMLMFKCIQPSILQNHFICCNGKLLANSDIYTAVDEDEDGIVDHIRYKHTKRRLPQCLIVGVRKGGTRALLEFLNLHPAIQAQKKEMHFFDHDDNFSFGLEWYRKKMPYSFPQQVTIEKTPGYFVEEKSPERVYSMNETVKLVVVVRDPTERAISDYMQIHTNRLEKKKFHEGFEDLVIDSETGEVRRSYNAIRRSIYHRHMEHWLKWFPLEQFHFVSGENLVKSPWEELHKVESFLGIEHKLSASNFYYNSTRGFYCLLKEPSGKEKCLARSKGRKHPEVNPIVIRKLHEFFRPHNAKFYDLVGRDFGWP